MNKRIEELADKAARFSATMALPTGESGDKLFVTEFAESIINECLLLSEREMLRNGTDSVHNVAIRKAMDSIKKHFGVSDD